MAWESRERGGRYYTRSRREGGRVVREYVGVGEIAETLAQTDEAIRRRRRWKAERDRAERERLEALTQPVEELCEAASVLLRAHLVAGGYHRHKGEWRKARDR